MKILFYYRQILIFMSLSAVFFFGYFISLSFVKQNFVTRSQIQGLVNPDTFKIKINKKEFFITSALIKTPRGDEPCSKAKNMASIGYDITSNMLLHANVIRYELLGGKEDQRYLNARIYIDEVLLGKLLYKKNAAIKYVNKEKICQV